MQTVTAQAGIRGQVIDLHAAAWRTEDRASCCPGCAAFDRWVHKLGGYASTRFFALWDEAREMAGPGGEWRYLDLVRATDEGNVIDMTSGEEQAAAQRAEDAGIVYELVRRLDGAAADRRRRLAEIRLAEDQAAVDALLNRSAEVALAMDELRADPRVARALDADLEGPGLSSAEVAMELRASMGLANRPPTAYEAGMPEAGDLARAIGVRS